MDIQNALFSPTCNSQVSSVVQKDAAAGSFSLEENESRPLDQKIQFILDKLVKHKHLSQDEANYIEKNVDSPEEVSDAIVKLKGPGEAAGLAYRMGHGVLLPNGIMAPKDDPGKIEKLAALSKADVAIIEEATGCDMSMGQIGILGYTIANERKSGNISGMLQLGDFERLKDWFMGDFIKDKSSKVQTEKMLDNLYKALERRDVKSKPLNRPLGL